MSQKQFDLSDPLASNFLQFQAKGDPAFINDILSPEGWVPDCERRINENLPTLWSLYKDLSTEGGVVAGTVDELNYYPSTGSSGSPLIVYYMQSPGADEAFSTLHDTMRNQLNLLKQETYEGKITQYIYGNTHQVVILLEMHVVVDGEIKHAAAVLSRSDYDRGYKVRF